MYTVCVPYRILYIFVIEQKRRTVFSNLLDILFSAFCYFSFPFFFLFYWYQNLPIVRHYATIKFRYESFSIKYEWSVKGMNINLAVYLVHSRSTAHWTIYTGILSSSICRRFQPSGETYGFLSRIIALFFVGILSVNHISLVHFLLLFLLRY